MFDIRMTGTRKEIDDYLDMMTNQGAFYVKISEPVSYADYIAHTMAKSGRTDAYKANEYRDKDVMVVFIRAFNSPEELVEDLKKEKRRKKKQEDSRFYKTVSTSSGVSYGGRRPETEEE